MERKLMIDFQFEKDRRKFLKHSLAIAKKAELDAEEQRVKLGFIPQIRRPLIDKIYNLTFIPK